MPKAWRKVFREANSDPKLRTLPEGVQLAFFKLLLELEDDGSLERIPDLTLPEQVAAILHCSTRAATERLDRLARRGLFAIEGDKLLAPAFEERQARAGATPETVETTPSVEVESDADRRKRLRTEKQARWRARCAERSTVTPVDHRVDRAVDPQRSTQGSTGFGAVDREGSTSRARAEAESEAEVEKKQRGEGERAGATPSLPPVTIPLRGEQPEPVAEAQATLETLHRESQGRVPAQADTESLRALGRFLTKQKQVRGYAPPAFVALGWYLRLQGGDDGFADPVLTPARLCARDCALLLSLLQEATAWAKGGCKRQRRKSATPHRAEEIARALGERLNAMAPMRGAA